MMNLGRNSVKFTSSGWIRFRAVIVDGFVELHVEDTGNGIPESKRRKLFERFQTSLDVLSQGTGIGLSLCKSLSELLNADIYLDENYDSGIVGSPGARFVVKLNTRPISLEKELVVPSKVQDLAIHHNRHDTEPYGLPEKLSVLFVDDDTVLRKLFRRSVSRTVPGWSIQEAASGEAALRMVDTESFDLVFMDQYMSSTSKTLLGTETIRELRLAGFDSTICGLSANDIEQEFIGSGADCFILKPLPCKPDDLMSVLVRILQSSEARKPVSSGLRDAFLDDTVNDTSNTEDAGMTRV